MEISDGYLEPVKNNDKGKTSLYQSAQIANNIQYFLSSSQDTNNFSGLKIALLGVPEDRSSANYGCAKAPDLIRNELYRLFCPFNMPGIIDMGNLKSGISVNDTYVALRDVTKTLLSNGLIPVILGGSQDLTYALFLALEQLKHSVNITCIDSRIDIGDSRREMNSVSYISRIVLEKSNRLFNFSNIGSQNYLVSQDEMKLMEKLYFDSYRLGSTHSDIFSIEPVLRDTDLLSLDIGSVRQSEAPAQSKPSPNGFYAEEVCQFARFAGLSNRCNVFGLFEVNPDYDNQNLTISLAAQIIWHFIEGVSERKKDSSKSECTRYIVKVEEIKQEITFYRCNKTNRWWIEIPYKQDLEEKAITISCSYKDYKMTCKGDIPDRLWRVYQKL